MNIINNLCMRNLILAGNEIMFSFSTGMFLKIIKQAKTIEIHTINTAQALHSNVVTKSGNTFDFHTVNGQSEAC